MSIENLDFKPVDIVHFMSGVIIDSMIQDLLELLKNKDVGSRLTGDITCALFNLRQARKKLTTACHTVAIVRGK